MALRRMKLTVWLCYVPQLKGENVVERFREFAGPVRQHGTLDSEHFNKACPLIRCDALVVLWWQHEVETAKVLEPQTLRARFGINDVSKGG